MVDFKPTAEVAIEAFERIFNPPPAIQMHDWLKFNSFSGGLRMNEFSILCGGTGVGKTTWLANLSAQLLKANVPQFVMSVETGRIDYMCRIVSSLADIDLNTGEKFNKDNPELHKKISAMLPEFGKGTIMFSTHENRITIEQLLVELKFMHEVYGASIAILDNLNFFLNITSAQNAIVEMDRVTHELIMFCKEHAMHIFMVMHPKKTDHGQVLSEFDIKGSSTAVQEAQNIFLLNRPVPGDEKKITNIGPFDRLLKIAKMRRRGKYVGRTLVYGSNGINYFEKEIV